MATKWQRRNGNHKELNNSGYDSNSWNMKYKWSYSNYRIASIQQLLIRTKHHENKIPSNSNDKFKAQIPTNVFFQLT